MYLHGWSMMQRNTNLNTRNRTMNKQWDDFREKLYDYGYHTLWRLEGRPEGLRFDLVCMTTAKGTTIFQVWKDAGFQVYTDSSPNKVDELQVFLTTEASR